LFCYGGKSRGIVRNDIDAIKKNTKTEKKSIISHNN